MLCVNTTGEWALSYGNPNEAGQHPIKGLITTGTVSPLAVGSWHRLGLTTVKGGASGMFDGAALFSATPIRNIDAG